ncbi:MAG TPA: FAD-dependent tricarballylate dehydrogenase TcuA [Candidatus Acidoferrales bacterium]|nr:FAD-dependent tricarballylate dehydrogenase TcuA [Candidatus Acidoferrales bacterium]
MKSERTDVIVVGGGSAAFEAAVAARQNGAERVVMLEKAPESEFGGNARFSHTGFRFCHRGAEEIREFIPQVPEAEFRRMHIPPYTAEQFMADLKRVTQERIDSFLAELLVKESNAGVHWMRELGIKWEPERYVTIDGRHYFEPGMVVHPAGGVEGGLGQLMQWREIAARLGVEIRFESRVCALHGNDRKVEGVRVSAAAGEYDLVGAAVILCSGGFQASPEMRARYLGPNADLMKVRGSKHDTGEVLQMALALGAKAAGHWQGAHATPIDARSPEVEISAKANRYSYVYGITVNSLGQRFFDEGEARSAYTYAKTGWAVLRQPGAIAYQIFDRKAFGLFHPGYRFAEPVEAGTIPELAEKIGIELALLTHTVEAFNKAVRADIPFDPTRLDGKCTAGIAPPKSNWAVPIDEPPFRAYRVTGGITFTFGGLQIDGDARVLNTGLRPIRGLYASGDIVGLFFHNYPSCSGQTRNVVFSRLAAKHAARSA